MFERGLIFVESSRQVVKQYVRSLLIKVNPGMREPSFIAFVSATIQIGDQGQQKRVPGQPHDLRLISERRHQPYRRSQSLYVRPVAKEPVYKLVIELAQRVPVQIDGAHIGMC